MGDSLDYGLDADGADCHDLLGTRCAPYVNQLLAGTAYDFHCHFNLNRATLSVPLWGPDAGAEPICHPIVVQVYDLDDDLLADWTPPARARYLGASGVRHGYLPSQTPPPPLTHAVADR
ncbi:hypothetical protein ACWEQC_35065 [Streptomyces shenzhenensis]